MQRQKTPVYYWDKAQQPKKLLEKRVCLAYASKGIRVHGGGMEVLGSQTAAESSPLKPQTGSREAGLETTMSSETSKPDPSDISSYKATLPKSL